jgi:hypothetical protein
MFDDTATKLSEGAVSTYCSTHMHHELALFKCSILYSFRKGEGLICWEGTEESYKPGCYLLYSEFGALLYAVVSTTGVGPRLYLHTRKTPRRGFPHPHLFKLSE